MDGPNLSSNDFSGNPEREVTRPLLWRSWRKKSSSVECWWFWGDIPVWTEFGEEKRRFILSRVDSCFPATTGLHILGIPEKRNCSHYSARNSTCSSPSVSSIQWLNWRVYCTPRRAGIIPLWFHKLSPSFVWFLSTDLHNIANFWLLYHGQLLPEGKGPCKLPQPFHST